MNDFEHSRRHYRIVYPAPVRPRFHTANGSYPVLDLSEGGLRYTLPEPRGSAPTVARPDPGTEVVGHVAFCHGASIPVRGRVVRVEGVQVALQLEAGVPYKVILEEQRYLLAKNYGLDW